MIFYISNADWKSNGDQGLIMSEYTFQTLRNKENTHLLKKSRSVGKLFGCTFN